MLCTGADDINSCSVYTAVTEDVGKLGDVLFDPVKNAGKKVPQIMRKNFVRVDVGFHAQRFHIPPDIRPTNRFSAARDEYTA